MLSGLNQGSFVYIFDKTDKPKLKIGEVVGITQPKFCQNGIANMVVDMKVKIDDIVIDYFNIPSNSSIVSYNGGKITISETKQGLQTEIETALENSKNIVNNIEYYKTNIETYENILKEINPQFAKDKERDTQISNLEIKVSGIETKLDKILEAINKS